LFKNKEDCLAYLKSHYGNDFISPVYTIDTVRVGSGWELVDREIIYDISLQKENNDELH
jgi:hypothetical protein